MNLTTELKSNDLADYNSPISNLFKQPTTPEEWEPYVLSQDQIDFFKEKGFLSGIKILEEDQVDLLNEQLGNIQSAATEEQKKLFYHYESNESEDPNRVLFHAIGGWRTMTGFHDLLWAPAYRMAAYQLMGGSFKLFHDQLFCKPAKHGGVVAWHQDFSYWTFTKPMNHLTCWLGLDDANDENGCLYFIPGSHKWGLLPVTGLTGDMDSVRKVLDDEQVVAFDNKVANVLPKGYASFHHPQTMHGSYENKSDRSRRAIVLNSMDKNTLSNIDDFERKDALKNFPPMGRTGELLADKCFPVLFDADKELGALKKDIPVTTIN
jgi:ectoine hydroxylase-related dioxygenase (phytanoyl-CoA dioxygenase family)